MLYVCVWDMMNVVFCLNCEAWSYRCSCMGSMSVSLCRCCMFVLCASYGSLQCALCTTCSLLMLVEDGRSILQSRSHDCLICSHECLLLLR